jgi:hypothetical protein
MGEPAQFLNELKALERIQSDLASIAIRTGDDRRYELIQLRKALSQQIGRVGQAGEPIFGSAANPVDAHPAGRYLTRHLRRDDRAALFGLG